MRNNNNNTDDMMIITPMRIIIRPHPSAHTDRLGDSDNTDTDDTEHVGGESDDDSEQGDHLIPRNPGRV